MAVNSAIKHSAEQQALFTANLTEPVVLCFHQAPDIFQEL